jgi:hypothetical protein
VAFHQVDDTEIHTTFDGCSVRLIVNPERSGGRELAAGHCEPSTSKGQLSIRGVKERGDAGIAGAVGHRVGRAPEFVGRSGIAQIQERGGQPNAYLGCASAGSIAERLCKEPACFRVVAHVELRSCDIRGKVREVVLEVTLARNSDGLIEGSQGIGMSSGVAVVNADHLKTKHFEGPVAKLAGDGESVFDVASSVIRIVAVLDEQRATVRLNLRGSRVVAEQLVRSVRITVIVFSPSPAPATLFRDAEVHQQQRFELEVPGASCLLDGKLPFRDRLRYGVFSPCR